MPDYGKRTGRDAFESLERRLASAERELRRGRGGGLSTFDRGDTLTQPAPVEGQTMVQYDTDEPWYYANGEWRDFCCPVTSGGETLYDQILATTGLLAFWPLDDAPGSTTAADASGGGRPLVNVPGGYSLFGNPTVPFVFGAPELIVGHTSAYTGSARAMYRDLSGWMSGDCSGEIWFHRTTGLGGLLMVCDSSVGSVSPAGIGLHKASDSAGVRDRVYLVVNGIEVILGDSVSAIGPATPTHVAFTRTSGVWRLYVNGVVQSTTSSAVFSLPTNSCRVGHMGALGPTFTVSGEFNGGNPDQTAGRIAYAAAYNVALDAATIADRYAGLALPADESYGKAYSADGSGGMTFRYPVAVWINGA